MYRRFAFEGDIHETLECVPLAVRRKLDLAALKISLAGWQELARTDRLALCHLPVDGPGDVDVYREVLRGFAERVGVALSPLQVDCAAWRTPAVPDILRAQTEALGITLADASWRELGEEERYALLKLADPKRPPARLLLLLAELGLSTQPAEPHHPSRVVCGPAVTP